MAGLHCRAVLYAAIKNVCSETTSKQLRNLVNNKFYAAINILGLAFSLATCLLILLYVIDEQGFDRYNENAKRIFRVNNEVGSAIIIWILQCQCSDGPTRKEFPQVEQYTRLQPYGSFLVKKGSQDLRGQSGFHLDSTLLKFYAPNDFRRPENSPERFRSGDYRTDGSIFWA